MRGGHTAPELTRETRAAMDLRCAPHDQVLAVVSHELRQPLNVIRMNAELLERLPASAASGRVQGIVQAMQRAISSQARIIDDLLDASRARTGKLTLRRAQVDLGALVLDFVAALAPRWSSGSILTQMQADFPLICHADAVRLEQILGNLLDNAMKFSPDGAQVRVRLSSEGGFARLSVTDSGCGIAHDFLPHVFGLFRQADTDVRGSHGGLGVGLALVHGLVVAHGGFVKASSPGPGRGAEFNVWLPLLQSA